MSGYEMDDAAFERAHERMVRKRNREAFQREMASMPPLDFDPSVYRLPIVRRGEVSS